MTKAHGLVITLLVCVIGLYGSFILWSVLQERINTKPYGTTELGDGVYFKAPLMINIVQAFFASIVGFVYCMVTTKTSPFNVFTKNESSLTWKISKLFVLIAITSSLSSPLGYESLKHVDYLAYLLAKSCKLIPVMLIHMVFYGTRFPLYKYIVAISVTFGVTVFTLSHHASKNSASIDDGDYELGMAQLIGSMLLDGLTNSTQDQLFQLQASNPKMTKITGASLMCILNLLVCGLSLSFAVISKYHEEIDYTLQFIREYPAVLRNILEFALFGSIGQVFVFIILEKFDSLILITATVTRKMISMILSVILFGHYLNNLQWGGVGLVFAGIGYEAVVKMKGKKPTKEKKA